MKNNQLNQIGQEKKGMQRVNQMKLVGNYIIYQERLLGTGQYGKVYEASEQSNQSKRYAVKVIPSQIFQQSMSNSQMLQKEIEVLKKLRHDNLVCLHEISQSPNNLYLFLDYCNGGDLAQYIDSKPQKKLSESEALELFKQYVDGYHHLYLSKIIHRDIKPENLMLHNGKIKLGDFGFGRFIEGNMNQQSRMSIKCTPIYASPQLLKKEQYSSKCDIWSSGCLLYKMLFGEYPFIAKDMMSLIKDIEYKVRGKEFQFSNDCTISEDVKNLLRKMFKYDEVDRISWEDLFNHPVLTNKQNILNNQDDLISEQEKSNPIFQSIIQNRNHVLDNDLITDHAQNLQVRKVPEYSANQPALSNNNGLPMRSKSPNPPQIAPIAIGQIPAYQPYKLAEEESKANNNTKNYSNSNSSTPSNQYSYQNHFQPQNDIPRINSNDHNKINNNISTNNTGNNNYNSNNIGGGYQYKGKVEQSPINNLVGNNNFLKVGAQGQQQTRAQTGDFSAQLNQPATSQASTQNTVNSAQNNGDGEEDHYRNSLQKFQQQDIEQLKIGKVDKMILFLRNQALFADVTMQLVFGARHKYQFSTLMFYELIYSLTGFYNFNLDLLKKILNQSFPNKLINEEDFQIYLNSKQFKKTFQKIEKDSLTANNFFKTLSSGILKEIQQQLNDPATMNYDQVKDFEKFIKMQSNNYKEYRNRFINIAKTALLTLNPEKFEKDLNSLRGIRDEYMPIQQFLNFDFRYFYDQYMNKIEADKLLRDIQNEKI